MNITKAKLLKDGKLSVCWESSSGEQKEKHQAEYDHAAHDDLKTAFKNLVPHFGRLIEELPLSIGVDDEILGRLHVTSFSIGGKEDDAGVIITGTKCLTNAKTILINSPFTRLNEDQETAYKFAEVLEEDLRKAKSEIIEYIHGKAAPDQQLSMDLPDGDITHAQIAEPEVPVFKLPESNGKKKKAKAEF